MTPALFTSLGTLAVVIVGVATLWVKMTLSLGRNGRSLRSVVERIERRQIQLGERVAKIEGHLSIKGVD